VHDFALWPSFDDIVAVLARFARWLPKPRFIAPLSAPVVMADAALATLTAGISVTKNKIPRRRGTSSLGSLHSV
jgi:hypothetical protein